MTAYQFPPGTPDLLTVPQAADLLHLSQSSVRSYMRQGKLRGYRVAGERKLLFHREAVAAMLEAAPLGCVNGEEWQCASCDAVFRYASTEKLDEPFKCPKCKVKGLTGVGDVPLFRRVAKAKEERE